MGKNILFFNATYIKKILTLKSAKDLGLQVSVVGPDLPEWSKPYVDHFIKANTYDMDETIAEIKNKHESLQFHGVITFWDRDVVPVAITAQTLGLKGSRIEAAERARNKAKMRESLKFADVPHPKFERFTSWEELYRAATNMTYPLIIKPVGASASKGIFKVPHSGALYQLFEKLVKSATPDNDIMFSFYRNEYIVEEFMDGQEVSVEGVIADGSIYFAGITEKWTDDFFEEYQHAFPARLTKALGDEILEVTRKGIEALELDNCGFHAEVMITGEGCKIVEINGRLGGDFITTHLVPLAKGINITEANLLAVLGGKFSFSPTRNKGACVKFLIAEKEGIVKEWQGAESVRNMPGVIDFVVEKQPGDYVGLPPSKFHDSRIAYVITEGEDTGAAIENAENALSKVRCLINEVQTSIPSRNS
ncbi:biotin carboxylase [Paenibacillus forsythiae]|uniref:Biotin carboxylase n=1 Tax=Paenibacillus forsythiae TaxID=365616 RepID=A0ABU3HA25_9BACL|nr:ATP-grasp domain-containing protein [Paenibacillus forsythiae]MDT3427673.1 biotin carboxylase [Paenibacillus forsythiae]